MEKLATYKYMIRPAEKAGKSLLIFLDMPDNKYFIREVIQAFNEINFQLTETEDRFENDELAVKVTSDTGEFILFRDNEDYYSISGAESNVQELNTILEKNPAFLNTI